jgi:hypothetical protein
MEKGNEMKFKKLVGFGIFALLTMSLLGLFFRPQRFSVDDAYRQGFIAGQESLQEDVPAAENAPPSTSADRWVYQHPARFGSFGLLAVAGFIFRFFITLLLIGFVFRFLFGRRRWHHKHWGSEGRHHPGPHPKWAVDDEPIMKA